MIKFKQACLASLAIFAVGCSGGTTTEPSGTLGKELPVKPGDSSKEHVRIEPGSAPDLVKATPKDQKVASAPVDPSIVTEKEMGLPYFPGSESVPKADMKVEADQEHSFKSVRATRATSKEVMDFYRKSIKGAEGDESTIVGKLSDGRMVAVMTLKVGEENHIQISVSNSNLIKK